MSYSSAWNHSLESTTHSASELGAPQDSAVVACLTILWHPDPWRVGAVAPLSRLQTGKHVALSRLEPAFVPPEGSAPPSPLADPFLSRQPVQFLPALDGGVRIDRGDTSTTVAVDGEPVETDRTLSADDVSRGVVLNLAGRVALVLHAMALRLEPPPAFGLVGHNDALVRVREEVVRLASLDFPVLVRGESGTGKELVARALHDAGPRRSGPFVSVNMGALPPTLAAAELFGAARGAYTGAARSRAGFFQQADGGTLFLDEVGETPPEIQVLLLRVLESGRVHPVGAAKPVRVDVRVVAATDADLEAQTEDGTFRSPLLHRLCSYEVEMPPLRARREDIGRLFLHFLRRELDHVGEAWRLDDPGPGGRPWVDASLVSRLAVLRWPGNVRQLRNVVRHLVVRSQGGDELQLTPRVERMLVEASDAHATAASVVRYRRPNEIGEAELSGALRTNRWHVQRTAEQLNVSRTTLYALMDASPTIRTASELSEREIERSRALCGGDPDAMAEQLEVSKHGLRLRMRELGIRSTQTEQR